MFGAVLGRALDRWWVDDGRPDPWFVVEVGAGPGTLARSVLASEPACAPALRYVLVERSGAQRLRHHEHLPLEPSAWAFAGAAREDDEPGPIGLGPIAVSLAELPEVRLRGVVLANELLDNLPFALVERTEAGWEEVWVDASATTSGAGALSELLVPARPSVASVAGALAPGSPMGARVPVEVAATSWLGTVLDQLETGRVAVFDFVRTTAELAGLDPSAWLRTYRAHRRGAGPLDAPGDQDVTHDVALDQLARVRPPDRVMSQAEFLAEHGLAELVAEGAEQWAAGAATGGLDALRGRSRQREAEALTDPDGLGGFSVVEWVVG